MNLCLHVVFGVVLFTAIGMVAPTLTTDCFVTMEKCREPMSSYQLGKAYDKQHACTLMTEEVSCLQSMPDLCLSDSIVDSVLRVAKVDRTVTCG